MFNDTLKIPKSQGKIMLQCSFSRSAMAPALADAGIGAVSKAIVYHFRESENPQRIVVLGPTRSLFVRPRLPRPGRTHMRLLPLVPYNDPIDLMLRRFMASWAMKPTAVTPRVRFPRRLKLQCKSNLVFLISG